MFTSIHHFLSIWDLETTATVSCFNKLTDESLAQEPVAGYRTIGRLANHIADCVISIPHEAGISVAYEKTYYTHQQQLQTAYIASAQKVKEAVEKFNDEFLQEDVSMYGETWKRGFALWVTVTHQIHHRGQLTVLMRGAGLSVPGIYGPCKEEWEAMGLPKAD